MSLSNIIELAAIVVVFGVLIALRLYTRRKLNNIDGCGQVYQKRDVGGKDVIHF